MASTPYAFGVTLEITMSKVSSLQAFVARGLASRDNACQSGSYVEAKDVLAALQSQLDAACKGQVREPGDKP